MNVAKFDCSVFKPLCEDVGVMEYPSLVWMKKGDVFEYYKGDHDLESLKTYVFEMIMSTKPTINSSGKTDVDPNIEENSRHYGSSELGKLGEEEINNINEEISADKDDEKDSTETLKDSMTVQSDKKEAPKVVSSEESSSYESEEKPVKVVDEESSEKDIEESSSTDETEEKVANDDENDDESSETGDSSDKTSTEESIEESNESEDKSRQLVKQFVMKSTSKFLELSAGNFSENLNPSGVTLIMMYAPWCEFCKDLRIILKKVALKNGANSAITIGGVDCTKDENKMLCFAQNVKGVPTLNLYKNGELLLNDYRGMTLERIDDAVVSHLTAKGMKKWKRREEKRKLEPESEGDDFLKEYDQSED